eukprot:Hpha_TRINITY_DN12611_c0_g1::TRINITY_DN12611_c0_g1_i1::g.49478::m.49478
MGDCGKPPPPPRSEGTKTAKPPPGSPLQQTENPQPIECHARCTPEVSVEDFIILGGKEISIGAPVITFKNRAGYDGYKEHCHFSERQNPSHPAASPWSRCDQPKRYDARTELHIDQVVVHYDECSTSQNCFKVLHDERGLSCHFLLDVDGTLYQTLDIVDRARHCGRLNCRSVGIEIAHPGPLEVRRSTKEKYKIDEIGQLVYDLEKLAEGVRTRGFKVHPQRREAVRGQINGRDLTMHDFTAEQYGTLVRLLSTLSVHLRLRLDAPRDGDGKVRTDCLTEEEQDAFSGVLGHYHLSKLKVDPGPAFDWETVLRDANEMVSKKMQGPGAEHHPEQPAKKRRVQL